MVPKDSQWACPGIGNSTRQQITIYTICDLNKNENNFQPFEYFKVTKVKFIYFFKSPMLRLFVDVWIFRQLMITAE